MTREELLRLVRTICYLRPSQVFWRTYYSLESILGPGVCYLIKPAEPKICLREDFPLISECDNSQSRTIIQNLSLGIFEHLNAQYNLGFPTPDWDVEGLSPGSLWKTTLHYHGWLFTLANLSVDGSKDSDKAWELFQHLLRDWLTRCADQSLDRRDTAWNSYAVATRISRWVRSYGKLASAKRSLDPDLRRRFLESLWHQASHLSSHLEYDLRGNHLIRDAVGLASAGRFFRGSCPNGWLKTATTLAADQCREQVLPDGGHFERSVMYHVETMTDILRLGLLVEDQEVKSQLKIAWLRMAEFLQWAIHPDGRVPLFNDAAFNGSCMPTEMLIKGSLLGCQVNFAPTKGGKFFPNYGLVCWHDDLWTIFFDVGPLGVDYQPGHGHADTLSIEASFRGHRLFVDPGTWGYDFDDRRAYDRSTRSHNTLCVDELDSSEVWHIFRCGRRAYPEKVDVHFGQTWFSASAAHSGYLHVHGRPYPCRDLHLRDNSTLLVEDTCAGEGSHTIASGLLLAPGWQTQATHHGWKVSRDDCGALFINVSSTSEIRLQTTVRPYHPEFGKEELTTRLEWIFCGELPLAVITSIEPT